MLEVSRVRVLIQRLCLASLLAVGLSLLPRPAAALEPVRASICELHTGLEFLDDRDHAYLDELCSVPEQTGLGSSATVRRLLHRGSQYYMLLGAKLQVTTKHQGEDNSAEQLWRWLRRNQGRKRCRRFRRDMRSELDSTGIDADLLLDVTSFRSLLESCRPPQDTPWDDLALLAYVHDNKSSDEPGPDVEFFIHHDNTVLYRMRPLVLEGKRTTIRYIIVPKGADVMMQVLDEGMDIPWTELVTDHGGRMVRPQTLAPETVDFVVKGGEDLDFDMYVDGYQVDGDPMTLSGRVKHRIQVFFRREDGNAALIYEAEETIPSDQVNFDIDVPLFDSSNVGLLVEVTPSCRAAIQPRRVHDYVKTYVEDKSDALPVSIVFLSEYASLAAGVDTLLPRPREGGVDGLDKSRDWLDSVLADIDSVAKLIVISVHCDAQSAQTVEFDVKTIDMLAHLNRRPVEEVIQHELVPALDPGNLRPSLERVLDTKFSGSGAAFVRPSEQAQLMALDLGSGRPGGLTFAEHEVWVVGAAFAWNLPCEAIKWWNGLDQSQAKAIVSHMAGTKNLEILPLTRSEAAAGGPFQIGGGNVPKRLRDPAQDRQANNQLLIAPSRKNLLDRPAGAYALISRDDQGAPQLLAARCIEFDEAPSTITIDYMWGRNLLSGGRMGGHRASLQYLLPQSRHFYWSFGANYSYGTEIIYTHELASNWEGPIEGLGQIFANAPGQSLSWSRHGLGGSAGFKVNFVPHARKRSAFRRLWVGAGAGIGVNVGLARLRGTEALVEGGLQEPVRTVDLHLEATVSAEVRAKISKRVWVGMGLSVIAGGVLRPGFGRLTTGRSGLLWIRPVVGFGWDL